MMKKELADRDLYSGLIRLHILHHAIEEPIFGLGMAEELARHGYRISPGTLYPFLDGLEKKGYLRSSEQRNGKSRRRVFRASPQGRRRAGGREGQSPRTIRRAACGGLILSMEGAGEKPRRKEIHRARPRCPSRGKNLIPPYRE